MPIIRRSALVVTLLFVAAGARHAVAQDTTRKWSIAVDNQSGVYIGIGVSSTFRFEPEISLQRQRDKVSFTIDNGFGTPTVINDELTSAYYRLGAGFLWQWEGIPRVRLYTGPRAGVIFVRSKERVSGGQSGTSSANRSDWFLAGSLGAEYFPADRFSAGAEAQLRGVAQGASSQQSSGSSSNGLFAPSDPTLSTRGLLTVRFYF